MNDLISCARETASKKALLLFRTDDNKSVIRNYLAAYVQKHELPINPASWQADFASQMQLCEQMLLADIIKDSSSVEQVIFTLNKTIVTGVIKKMHHDAKFCTVMQRPTEVLSAVRDMECGESKTLLQSVTSDGTTSDQMLQLDHINGDRYIAQSIDPICCVNGLMVSMHNDIEDLVVNLQGQEKQLSAKTLTSLNSAFYHNYHVMVLYVTQLNGYAIVQVGLKKHVGSLKFSFNEALCKMTGFQFGQYYEVGAIALDGPRDNKSTSGMLTLSFMDVEFDSFLGSRLVQHKGDGNIVYFQNGVHVAGGANKIIVHISGLDAAASINLLVSTTNTSDHDDQDCD